MNGSAACAVLGATKVRFWLEGILRDVSCQPRLLP